MSMQCGGYMGLIKHKHGNKERHQDNQYDNSKQKPAALPHDPSTNG